MKVYWYTTGPDGKAAYSTTPVETPGRYNFAQAAIYRLKLSNIEGRPGLELYPTMEVVPSNPKTDAFLAHNAVPIDFSAEDFKQVAEGNYITKVIYLPDPQYQDAAGTGIDEILSTRLEPGQDPIQEALKRGSILLVIRMGNVDQEAPNTPPLVSPGQPAAPAQPPFGGPMMQGGPAMPMLQVPYLGMPGAHGMPGTLGTPGMGPHVPLIAPPGALPWTPPMPNAADPRGAAPPPAGPFGPPGAPLAAPPGPNPLAPPNVPLVPGLEPSPPLSAPAAPAPSGMSDAGRGSFIVPGTASAGDRPTTLPVSAPPAGGGPVPLAPGAANVPAMPALPPIAAPVLP
jgi:hypothetical protein